MQNIENETIIDQTQRFELKHKNRFYDLFASLYNIYSNSGYKKKRKTLQVWRILLKNMKTL